MNCRHPLPAGSLHVRVILQGVSHRLQNMLLLKNILESGGGSRVSKFQPNPTQTFRHTARTSLKMAANQTSDARKVLLKRLRAAKSTKQHCWYFTSRQGNSLVSSEKSGSRTKRMKLVWEDGLDTLSRSMNGVTGRPLSFSVSLFTSKQKNWDLFTRQRILDKMSPFWSILFFIMSELKRITWLKNSCSRQSSQGSATAIGLASLEMSLTFTMIFISWKQERLVWSPLCPF